MRNTRSSRCISSLSASLSASRIRISVIAGLLCDVKPKRIQAGLRTRFGKSDRIIDRAFHALRDLGQAGIVEYSAFSHVELQGFDGVSLPVLFYFLLEAIELRVRHGMSAVAVGHRFDEVGAALGAAVLDGLLCFTVDFEDVHTVDLDRG